MNAKLAAFTLANKLREARCKNRSKSYGKKCEGRNEVCQ